MSRQSRKRRGANKKQAVNPANVSHKSTASRADSQGSPPFCRVVIEGVLTLKSELHIGSGLSESKDQEDGSLSLIERSVDGGPYIPGSGLRGALASQLDDELNAALSRRIFGLARQAAEDDSVTAGDSDQGGAGLLRVYDAQSKQTDVVRRGRTSIDPVTGAAKPHHLATQELVPEGAEFHVKLLLDNIGSTAPNITNDELDCLLGLLNGLNTQSLGSGKSYGQGKVEWTCESVESISEADYRSWLLSNMQRTANSPAKVRIKALSNVFKKHPQGEERLVSSQLHSWERQSFSLKPDGPILINDSEVEKVKDGPGVSFMTRLHNGKQCAVIPGSTLKGWFRAQSRRILLTLNKGQQVEHIDELLGQLFGSTETGMSCLLFEDAFVEFREADEHTQIFNAVDRFTGGVKDSALFSAHALWTNRSFESALTYQPHTLSGWMRLLLLYVWQDAKEGDLVLGWGKAKGFGRLKLVAGDDDQPGWLEKPDTKQFQQWESELFAVLEMKSEVSV